MGVYSRWAYFREGTVQAVDFLASLYDGRGTKYMQSQHIFSFEAGKRKESEEQMIYRGHYRFQSLSFLSMCTK